MDAPNEPDAFELSLLSVVGRLRRLTDTGMTLGEAAEKLLREETADEYLARNAAAMKAVDECLLSPEHLDRFAAAMSDPDPVARAARLADFKRETYAALDIEALHRHIRAQNKRMQAEGMLPPDPPMKPI